MLYVKNKTHIYFFGVGIAEAKNIAQKIPEHRENDIKNAANSLSSEFKSVLFP